MLGVNYVINKRNSLVDSMRIHIFASDKTLLYEKTNFINNPRLDGAGGSGAEQHSTCV